ncbi:isochorismatase family protein [Actinomyces lilanjuaniae]|uniref:isochorismatase n=1 Tax=Actinomyces lilanjuaniae TaxID=2321394 RepID=A0ABM6Z5W4_9ACTO|nr:isochorismatase family protein [Actinomyces lilanjuaniae]AYD90392.1 isochorismatase family protein [Actinomyces lilanjuaniae]
MIPQEIRYQTPIQPLPPSRAPWEPDPDRAVLLVHDMQEHFLSAYVPGEEPLPGLLHGVAEMVRLARLRGVPVVYTAQPAHQGRQERGLLQDLWGQGVADDEHAAIVPEVAPGPRDTVLTKRRYDAFEGTGLHELMGALGRDQLVITGVYAHIGCLATALRAFVLDLRPFLVADAVADLGADEHRMALELVSRSCGVVTDLSRMRQVLEGPGGPERPTQHQEGEQEGREPGQARPYPTSLGELAAQLEETTSTPADGITPDSELPSIGVDSVRMMMLTEAWSTLEAEVDFTDMVQCRTVADLADLLETTHGFTMAAPQKGPSERVPSRPHARRGGTDGGR